MSDEEVDTGAITCLDYLDGIREDFPEELELLDSDLESEGWKDILGSPHIDPDTIDPFENEEREPSCDGDEVDELAKCDFSGKVSFGGIQTYTIDDLNQEDKEETHRPLDDFLQTEYFLSNPINHFRDACERDGEWQERLQNEVELAKKKRQTGTSSKDLLRAAVRDAKARVGLENYINRLESLTGDPSGTSWDRRLESAGHVNGLSHTVLKTKKTSKKVQTFILNKYEKKFGVAKNDKNLAELIRRRKEARLEEIEFLKNIKTSMHNATQMNDPQSVSHNRSVMSAASATSHQSSGGGSSVKRALIEAGPAYTDKSFYSTNMAPPLNTPATAGTVGTMTSSTGFGNFNPSHSPGISPKHPP